MRKITQEEIQSLHVFTRKHFVEFYDVELELVDHLAQGIETQWEENLTLNFEEALQREFKKFGVFGFMGMIEERQAAMTKTYYRVTWKALAAYVTLPKLLLTLAILGGFYFIGAHLENAITYYYAIFGVIFLYMISSGMVLLRRIKNRQKITGKKWLIESVGGQFYAFPLGIFIVNAFNVMSSISIRQTDTLSFLGVCLFSVFLTFLVLMLIVSRQVIRPLIEHQIRETIQKHQFIEL